MIGVFYKYITRNLYFCKVKTKWQVELLKETYFPSQQEGVGYRRGFPYNRGESIGIGLLSCICIVKAPWQVLVLVLVLLRQLPDSWYWYWYC